MSRIRWLLPWLFMIPSYGTGQSVRGRVVLPDSVTPVASARLEVRDTTGTTVGRAVTGQDGRYAIQLPGSGSYELLASRIGYGPVRMPLAAVTTAEIRTLDVFIAEQPLRLDAIDVTGNDRCRMNRGERARFVELWLKARAALRPHLAEAGGSWEIRSVVLRRTEDGPISLVSGLLWNPNQRHPQVDSTDGREDVGNDFLATTSGEILAARGYVRGPVGVAVPNDVPNPEAVLSDAFLGSHCFGVEAGPSGHSDWVGLSFRPATDIDSLTDVAGTLWLDRETSTLRRLDFEYRNFPRIPFATCVSLNRPPRDPWGTRYYGPYCSVYRGRDSLPRPREGIGGTLDFAHQSGGQWFVAAWTLRTPGDDFMHRYAGFNLKVEDRRTVRCFDRPPACSRVFHGVPRLIVYSGTIATLWKDGVEVFRNDTTLAALSRIASLQAGRNPSHLAGTVRDAEGRPVPLAIISTGGPVRAAMTDSAGRFEIHTLPPGAVALEVRREGYRTLKHSLTLAANATLDVQLTLVRVPPE